MPIRGDGQPASGRKVQAGGVIPLRQRGVVKSGKEDATYEGGRQTGAAPMPEADLLLKVERLAGVSFLHCRLPFTPNQLEALAEKASRNSLSVEQLIERTAPRIYEHFYDLVERA